MASKLEYLQRYMSNGGGDATADKKKKKLKKSKKSQAPTHGTRVVDTDDTWEASAPSREAIEHKWEQDGDDDERPLVVAADGEEDPQDLPVYVDSDKYLGELQKDKQKKQQQDADLSPPRRSARRRPSDDESPPRRAREDASPPRRRRRDSDDESPPRRSREDASPPRRCRDSARQECGRSRGDDASPPRRTERRSTRSPRSHSRDRDNRHDSSSPRRSHSPKARRDRESRSSPVRRQRSSRKSSRWGSPRRKEKSRSRSFDRRHQRSHRARSRSRSNSPSREKNKPTGNRDESRSLKRPDSPGNLKTQAHSTTKSRKDPKKELGEKPDDTEKKAGLFTADEFEHQRKLAAKRKDMLRGADATEMGAKAETVYRDKRGRKLDMLNEMVRQQEVLEGKRKREAQEEYEWGTGAVQKRERKSQQELLEQMKAAPFARHEDDEELERMRRERVRAFDPINSKTFQEDPLADGGKSKKKKKSKKDKKEKKKSSAKPKYAGPSAPPNRFGILPGYRWDGVVRGTNWEEKIMIKQNASTAVSEDAYKYAVADM